MLIVSGETKDNGEEDFWDGQKSERIECRSTEVKISERYTSTNTRLGEWLCII